MGSSSGSSPNQPHAKAHENPKPGIRKSTPTPCAEIRLRETRRRHTLKTRSLAQLNCICAKPPRKGRGVRGERDELVGRREGLASLSLLGKRCLSRLAEGLHRAGQQDSSFRCALLLPARGLGGWAAGWWLWWEEGSPQG